MKLIRIIYIGSRTSHRQKRTYQYLNEISDNTTYNFSRRIAASEIIGSVVESRLSNGDKTFNDSKVVGFIDTSHSEFINLTRWSAEQKASNLELQAFADLKKEYSKSIENLIKDLKTSTSHFNSRDRARFARHVFEKLIK